MDALVFVLGIPLLGGWIAAADYLRRNGGTPRSRLWGQRLLQGGGGFLLVAGSLMLMYAFVALILPPEAPFWSGEGQVVTRFLSFLVRLVLGGLLVFAGWRSLGQARGESETASITAHIRREQQSAQFHLLKWILLLQPLLMLGFLGVVVALPVLSLNAFWFATIRAREAQLLWALTLATENGLPLESEVEAFALTLWRGPRRKLETFAGLLRDGHSFADALELAPRVLPRPIIMELRVAEELGTLPEALRQCALRQTRALSTALTDGSLMSWAAYAWGMLLVIPLLVSFLVIFIVPKFKSIFNDFDVELPALTRGLIQGSEIVSDNFGMLSLLFAVPILIAMAATVAHIVGWGNLNVPLLMRWFPRRDAPELLRSLALSVRAGRPLTPLLVEMADHQHRSDLAGRYRRMAQTLAAGEPTGQVLCQEGFIRDVEASALEASARNDNLPWTLRMLADGMDSRERRRIQFWIELLKPLFIVAIGLLVGLVVLGMFLPLVKLLNDLS